MAHRKIKALFVSEPNLETALVTGNLIIEDAQWMDKLYSSKLNGWVLLYAA